MGGGLGAPSERKWRDAVGRLAETHAQVLRDSAEVRAEVRKFAQHLRGRQVATAVRSPTGSLCGGIDPDVELGGLGHPSNIGHPGNSNGGYGTAWSRHARDDLDYPCDSRSLSPVSAAGSIRAPDAWRSARRAAGTRH